MSHKIDRTGEISYTRFGTPAKIIKYVSYKEIYVEFQDKYKYVAKTNYGNFKKCQMTNPYDKTFLGIGYLGDGEYNFKNSGYIMKLWSGILDRCYASNERYDNDSHISAYEKSVVSEEWCNFQNFAKWYHENEYPCPNEKLNVDKDIKKHGNKIYGKEYCMLIPEKINYLFIKAGEKRSNGLPVGVKRKNNVHSVRYIATLSKYNSTKYIGTFDDPHEAFLAYKKEKENYIKEIANDYKGVIPQSTYNLLLNYEVLETD